MSINVSTTMNFGNREFQKKSAKKNTQKDDVQNNKTIETTHQEIFDGSIYTSHTDIQALKTPSQITINSSLKETLRYLQAHANDKRKHYVLGELWEKMKNSLKESNEEKQNILVDFEIDFGENNIFAA